MVATEMLVTSSGTLTGAGGEIHFSGTQFTNQGAVTLTLLCAMSGLAVIPVRCDSLGRIGSVF